MIDIDTENNFMDAVNKAVAKNPQALNKEADFFNYMDGDTPEPPKQPDDPTEERTALKAALMEVGYKNKKQVEELSNKLMGTNFLQHKDLKQSIQLMNQRGQTNG